MRSLKGFVGVLLVGVVLGFLIYGAYWVGGRSASPIGTPILTAAPTQAHPTVTEGVAGACAAGMEVARCVNVVDGDTIDVVLEGQEYRVRYIGIDTPETPNECYSQEAEARNRELVLGQTVCMEKDVSETDCYGRLLRYVHVGDWFVNATLVREGYAFAATFPPDVAHAEDFLDLERQAREAGKGLWSGCEIETPTPPLGETCDCSEDLYNCGDFDTHDEAQACFEHCLKVTGQDVHRMDSDGDGSVCESLP